jgi:putative ABC transport system permease protein
MLTNNLRIAYRNLLKNRVFSYINILGLAIGIAAFMLIVQYVRFERSYESTYKHADNIFRLATEFYNGSELVTTDCETYAPLGPFAKANMTEVVDFARMYGIDGLANVKVGTQSFLESGMYWADHSVFNVFTYEVVSGDVNKALVAPFEIVLTESIAKKYFGRTSVVDESIDVDKRTFRVKAVVADSPPNTHLKFSFLLSRLSFPVVKPWYPDDKWGNNNEFTFVLTVPGTDVGNFNKRLNDLTMKELKGLVEEERFIAEPIKDIHLYSDKSYEPEAGGSSEAVYYLIVIALFIIAIAWVNYVNLSTARAVERAREVGIRKVMGSLKRQLIFQFLAESFIVNVVAGVIALMILQLSFPFFRDIAGQPLSLDLMGDSVIWYLFLGLVLAGTLLSGIYPAFVLSSFKPVAVLKGKFQSSSHGQLLRKGLVIFQFSATVVLIISTCTVYLQVQFMRNQNLGMDIDQILVLTGQQLNLSDSIFRQTSHTFKTELLKNSAIRSVGRGESLPGVDLQELSTTSVNPLSGAKNSRGYLYYYFGIDADYIPTMNITFVAGRNFQDRIENHDQVIINREAAKLLGFANPREAVGSKITFRTRGSADGSVIIGVLDDFHFRSPKEAHLPMLFYYKEPSDYFALLVRTDNMPVTLAAVRETWTKVYPDAVFNHFFLNHKYDQQYRADAQFGNVTAVFSSLIVIVACLGLFGLSSYTITQRTKEIGIRKVLGASVPEIVRLLSKDFATTVLIAAVIALPIAYFAMDQWLAQYYLRVTLDAWIFLFAFAVVLLLALMTVSFQTISIARGNATDALRQEG